ncbi:ATP-dependent DNA helicase RecG [Candidatus Falkowbacteria bacterium RIFOXYB2_FULL_38_15]|uniref:ATP-dependent DNA helicase RecG n=1 Tax=Candidatus Falkowbacteria bacterium RIFOXYA2_FULL_38_12 TaxID=1797993 RepID=A0A1F5S3I5_9BACT|nr:MAG: ATP-dependent DNA helicase RecG [Candidatus Falkowbacteria bacterium RIFOXYA2_FULL_38_12]OGF32648.1 MAG: ATP-dependent DNA helicase RecG [Candidatus Falkowbacteria bacterium RIFOXYB2_FULL_38_15]OGF44168.1 MAG: ATP-dependent DNA helicase RecG [Candidatus Falkowbacteria bacterium RIFOXYD2_FULL_39_16]
MINLDSPIEILSKVGKTTAQRLQKLGLKTAKDLLFYFPFRHEDWSNVISVAKLSYGTVATCRARVELIKNTRSFFKRKNITEALVSDNSGSIKVVWFNQPYLAKTLKIGDEIFLSGKVDLDRFGLHLTSPSYEKINREGETTHTARIVPIYSVTENLTEKQIRFLVKLIIPLAEKIEDWLPKNIKAKFNLVDLKDALGQIHFPDNKFKLESAKRRLKFDELFLVQLRNTLVKINLLKTKAPVINFYEEETKKFVSSLPFQLTDAQRKAAWEILQDLENNHPMNRLLEGDVGSGKTIVAAIAVLNVILNGKKAIVMVPTEILAGQHFKSFCKLFDKLNIKIGLLTRSNKMMNYEIGILAHDGEEKKLDLKFIINNSQLIIGTHALIQEGMEFNNLGLAIVDEQHRFGVGQRMAIHNKKEGISPHFLSMTATPIPRTMSLIFYGDLDLSIIDEMPVGRKKIFTKIVSHEKRHLAYDFVKQEIKKGRQIFIICPLIDPSDKLGVKSVKDEFEVLQKEIFPELSIGILHGKMKSAEKEEVMKNFLENKINILVSTSVIEVGIDVPNATIMIIEGAERFGLAQLHQFRGRVGRSGNQSFCLLFSGGEGSETMERLEALVNCNDGFALAEKDLTLRGPGEVWGTRQSGVLELKIASLADCKIAKEAKEAAEEIIKKDPELENFPDLKEKLSEFERDVHLE